MQKFWTPKKESYFENTLAPELAISSHIGLFTAIPQLDFLQTLVALAIEADFQEMKIQEALLQSYLFLGFPRTINALSAVEHLWKTPPQSFEAEVPREVFQKRGEMLCQKIYGENYSKLLHHMNTIHPDLKRYMIEEGYGKILSRDFLSPIAREFSILPQLIVMNVPKQLHSHLLGALYLGASPNQIEALFRHLSGPLEETVLGPAKDLFRSIKEHRHV
ncbi:MAG: hypothetical protein AABZ60_06335 [Planctomycetota bacterium]